MKGVCNRCGSLQKNIRHCSECGMRMTTEVTVDGSSTDGHANTKAHSELAQEAQSEAPSVDSLDKILYEYAMWRDNYYQDLEAGVLTEKEWIEVRDKVQSEAKAKINRLIEQAEKRGYAKAHKDWKTAKVGRRLEREELSNNLNKGDGDE